MDQVAKLEAEKREELVKKGLLKKKAMKKLKKKEMKLKKRKARGSYGSEEEELARSTNMSKLSSIQDSSTLL